ncbi:short transient receptor potential channel 4-like isoform X2 [Anneissia japonica]|uniref:short transient receptor potential channel 4-like isoform X2 n=1 Tax=Anneissia japonica TaxID=1529436 RepID=UPI0014254C07|nr:short transient receptor potential channel 4-like isoform X2 [Anneissia japonica]
MSRRIKSANKKAKESEYNPMMEEMVDNDALRQIYLKAAGSGNLEAVGFALAHAGDFDINCTDTDGKSALAIAIKCNNIEVVKLLLQHNVNVGDALLRAVDMQNVKVVEILLEYARSPQSMIGSNADNEDFHPSITPIILAAHTNNHDIIKMLLQHKATISDPWKNLKKDRQKHSVQYSLGLLNIYKALSSEFYISLTSEDPIDKSFELYKKLKLLARMEYEHKSEYETLAEQVELYAAELLGQTRNRKELTTVLTHDSAEWNKCPEVIELKQPLKVLKAVTYYQKRFVAHPHCQILLTDRWYKGLSAEWRANRSFKGILLTAITCILWPLWSLFYLAAPLGRISTLMRTPYIKFLMHTSSYVTFLVLLGCATSDVQAFQFPNITSNEGCTSTQKLTEQEHALRVRGRKPTIIQVFIMSWIIGMTWREVKELYRNGIKTYVKDMWNFIDLFQMILYWCWIALKFVSIRKASGTDENLHRSQWPVYDPNIVAEAMFAVANIFSFCRSLRLIVISDQVGPLQISLGGMIDDIARFLFIFTLVWVAFALGLTQLYWPYSPEEILECIATGKMDTDDCKEMPFGMFSHSMETLFWALFGLEDLSVLQSGSTHIFTEGVGRIIFALYYVCAVVILLNVLIAMMSSTFSRVEAEADIEWKFSRAEMWMSYFDDAATVPVPFNLVPSPKSIWHVIRTIMRCFCYKDAAKKSKQKHFQKVVEKEKLYEETVQLLVARYIADKKSDAYDTEGAVTQLDIIAVRQDISGVKNELSEFLRKMEGTLKQCADQIHKVSKRVNTIERVLKNEDPESETESTFSTMDRRGTSSLFSSSKGFLSAGGMFGSLFSNKNTNELSLTVPAPSHGTNSTVVADDDLSTRSEIESNVGASRLAANSYELVSTDDSGSSDEEDVGIDNHGYTFDPSYEQKSDFEFVERAASTVASDAPLEHPKGDSDDKPASPTIIGSVVSFFKKL